MIPTTIRVYTQSLQGKTITAGSPLSKLKKDLTALLFPTAGASLGGLQHADFSPEEESCFPPLQN